MIYFKMTYSKKTKTGVGSQVLQPEIILIFTHMFPEREKNGWS